MAATLKKARVLALPHDTTYSLVHSFYAGSLLDGGGHHCVNCGRLITQVAIVENAGGSRFEVGLDCAQTLAGIAGSGELEAAAEGFQVLAALRASIKTHTKKLGTVPVLQVQALLDGELVVEGQVKPGGQVLFRQYVSPARYEAIIKPGCPQLADVAILAAPTVHGTRESGLKRADWIQYQGRPLRVLDVRPNLRFAGSAYRQTLLIQQVRQELTIEELEQPGPFAAPAQ